jgi:hypothetical protein
MALTAKQRAKLPNSAFAYPKARKYPVPTKSQAKKAGISEKQRVGLHRNALSRSAQSTTSGSYGHVARHVNRRGPVTPKRKK